MTDNIYPRPRRDADNAAFLDGWRDGRLRLQRCAVCGHCIFYPRPYCPQCWSDQLEEVASAGRGIIISYSLVRRPNHPSFSDEVPIVFAEVELAENVRLLARIVETDVETVRSGLAVELIDPTGARRFPLPAFRTLSH